jgi:hypothetical protein
LEGDGSGECDRRAADGTYPAAQALGLYAELEVDETYVDMRPLTVFSPGAAGRQEVVVPYDDEGGDELALVLHLFALDPVETVEVPPK